MLTVPVHSLYSNLISIRSLDQQYTRDVLPGVFARSLSLFVSVSDVLKISWA